MRIYAPSQICDDEGALCRECGEEFEPGIRCVKAVDFMKKIFTDKLEYEWLHTWCYKEYKRNRDEARREDLQ